LFPRQILDYSLADAYQSEEQEATPLETNIRLPCKNVPDTNTLAYFCYRVGDKGVNNYDL